VVQSGPFPCDSLKKPKIHATAEDPSGSRSDRRKRTSLSSCHWRIVTSIAGCPDLCLRLGFNCPFRRIRKRSRETILSEHLVARPQASGQFFLVQRGESQELRLSHLGSAACTTPRFSGRSKCRQRIIGYRGLACVFSRRHSTIPSRWINQHIHATLDEFARFSITISVLF
jgi:hypothetical protein